MAVSQFGPQFPKSHVGMSLHQLCKLYRIKSHPPFRRRTWVAFHLHHPLEISQVDEGCEPPQHPRDEMSINPTHAMWFSVCLKCVCNVSDIFCQLRKRHINQHHCKICKHVSNISPPSTLSWREYGEIKLQQKYHHHSLQASP